MDYCFISSRRERLWAGNSGNFGHQEGCFGWEVEERTEELRDEGEKLVPGDIWVPGSSDA